MTDPTPNPADSPQAYCALAYVGTASDETPSHDGVLILVFLFVENSRARILVHPQWKSIVTERDQAYLENLLLDWKQRLATDPGALFQQVCFLSAGPLITSRTGPDFASDPSLGALAASFHDI